jgi:DNA-binding beta-propeller fold protein YncE
MKRLWKLLLMIVVVLALVAPAASADSQVCALPEIEEAFNDLTLVGGAEGVAVANNGDAFFGAGTEGVIFKVPRGDFTATYVLADLVPDESFAEIVGMDVDRHGNLYVAVFEPFDAAFHGIWKVEPDGTSALVGPLPLFFDSQANDIAIDNKGNVYASDPFAARIWRLAPDGTVSEWVVDDLLKAFFGDFEFGVNGLTYDRGALYGAITADGRVVKIPIGPDGAPGTPVAVIEDGSLFGIDGIELDPVGDIYVTNNVSQTIQRITKGSLIIETIVENNGGAPLSSPASMAFSRNHTSIYVANLNESGALNPQDPDNPLLVQVEFPVPVHAWNTDCG